MLSALALSNTTAVPVASGVVEPEVALTVPLLFTITVSPFAKVPDAVAVNFGLGLIASICV